MFLDILMKRNKPLVKEALRLHRSGEILPDTYVLDVDAIIDNAKKIKAEADKYGIKLYYMTKQIGRNPYIAKKIEELGYIGAVAVDYKEARVLHNNGVKIGHIGHLVQIPSMMVEDVVAMKPDIITVYSIEKAKEIHRAAKKLGLVQDIMIKVYRQGDDLYPGQYSGFLIEELEGTINELVKLDNIRINGITHFPCFLFKDEDIRPTKNLETLLITKKILSNLGVEVKQINTPSSNSVSSIDKVAKVGGTHIEPGHGLSGTTPYHRFTEAPEVPAMVYISEISHNFKGRSYFYGGGHYRRSHMDNAYVGESYDTLVKRNTILPDADSIDYYMELEDEARVGDSVVLNFRTQIFVTRSDVALVEGLSNGKPKLVGIYNSQGNQI